MLRIAHKDVFFVVFVFFDLVFPPAAKQKAQQQYAERVQPDNSTDHAPRKGAFRHGSSKSQQNAQKNSIASQYVEQNFRSQRTPFEQYVDKKSMRCQISDSKQRSQVKVPARRVGYEKITLHVIASPKKEVEQAHFCQQKQTKGNPARFP